MTGGAHVQLDSATFAPDPLSAEDSTVDAKGTIVWGTRAVDLSGGAALSWRTGEANGFPGGALVSVDSSVDLAELVFDGNIARTLDVTGGAVELTDVTVTGTVADPALCAAGACGWGARAVDASVIVDGGAFTRNDAEGLVLDASEADLDGVTFSAQIATDLRAVGSEVGIVRGVFEGDALYGVTAEGSALSILDTRFEARDGVYVTSYEGYRYEYSDTSYCIAVSEAATLTLDSVSFDDVDNGILAYDSIVDGTDLTFERAFRPIFVSGSTLRISGLVADGGGAQVVSTTSSWVTVDDMVASRLVVPESSTKMYDELTGALVIDAPYSLPAYLVDAYDSESVTLTGFTVTDVTGGLVRVRDSIATLEGVVATGMVDAPLDDLFALSSVTGTPYLTVTDAVIEGSGLRVLANASGDGLLTLVRTRIGTEGVAAAVGGLVANGVHVSLRGTELYGSPDDGVDVTAGQLDVRDSRIAEAAGYAVDCGVDFDWGGCIGTFDGALGALGPACPVCD